MEEVGFLYCVSVPDGAPPSSVSSKDLPPPEQVFFNSQDIILLCMCMFGISQFLLSCHSLPWSHV